MTRTHAGALFAVVALYLAALYTPMAFAANTTSTNKTLGLTLPPSARVHSTATTPATAAPATAPTTTSIPTAGAKPGTTPPTSTTPAGGAQPGTVAPATTAPTTATPTTPTVGLPTTVAPTNPPQAGSTTLVGIGARKTHPAKTRLSTGALALAVLGALLALGCLIWLFARWLALEPRWTVSFMHSLREASYRGSATWAEFSDWTRLGR